MPFSEQQAWALAVELGSVGKPIIGIGTAENQDRPGEWFIHLELNNGVPKHDEDGNVVSATEAFRLYYPSDRDKLNVRISELREALKAHIAAELKAMMEAAAQRDSERRAILSLVVEIDHEPHIHAFEYISRCDADGQGIPEGGTFYSAQRSEWEGEDDASDSMPAPIWLRLCPDCYQLAVDLQAAKLLEGDDDATQD